MLRRDLNALSVKAVTMLNKWENSNIIKVHKLISSIFIIHTLSTWKFPLVLNTIKLQLEILNNLINIWNKQVPRRKIMILPSISNLYIKIWYILISLNKFKL